MNEDRIFMAKLLFGLAFFLGICLLGFWVVGSAHSAFESAKAFSSLT